MIQEQNHPRRTEDDVKILRAMRDLYQALNNPVYQMKLREYFCEKIILPSIGLKRKLSEVSPMVVRWFELRSDAIHQALQVYGLHDPEHYIRKQAYGDQEKILAFAYERIFEQAWSRPAIQHAIIQGLKEEKIKSLPIFTLLKGREFEHRLYPVFSHTGSVKPDQYTLNKVSNGELKLEDIKDLAEKVKAICRTWPLGKPLVFCSAA